MSGNPGAGAIIIGTLVFREPERLPMNTRARLREIARHAEDKLPLTLAERFFVARAAFAYLEYV